MKTFKPGSVPPNDWSKVYIRRISTKQTILRVGEKFFYSNEHGLTHSVPVSDIEWMDPNEEWISVEDRLPEEYEWVLTYTDGGFPKALTFDKNTQHEIGRISRRAWRDPLDAIIKVTHWMPLPTPPSDRSLIDELNSKFGGGKEFWTKAEEIIKEYYEKR